MTTTPGVFGVPLSQATPPGCAVPPIITDCLDFLADNAGSSPQSPRSKAHIFLSSQSSRIRTATAPADLFANSSVSAAAAQRLAPLFEPGKHHPLEGTRGAEPHAVASLLLLYLQSLPHPIVPPKYYYTYVALNGEPHLHKHIMI